MEWFKDSLQYRTLDTIDGEPMEFERNIFPGFSTLDLVREVQKFMSNMGEPEQFQGRIIFMSMFNDITWGNKEKKLPAGRWSFLGLGSETKWCSTDKERPGGKWDRVAELMMIKIRRKRTPSFPSNASVEEVDNCLYTLVPMVIRLKLFFAQSFLLIISVFTWQSQMCVRNTVAVEQERLDPFWQSNPTHCSNQQTYW